MGTDAADQDHDCTRELRRGLRATGKAKLLRLLGTLRFGSVVQTGGALEGRELAPAWLGANGLTVQQAWVACYRESETIEVVRDASVQKESVVRLDKKVEGRKLALGLDSHGFRRY